MLGKSQCFIYSLITQNVPFLQKIESSENAGSEMPLSVWDCNHQNLEHKTRCTQGHDRKSHANAALNAAFSVPEITLEIGVHVGRPKLTR